MPKIKYGQIGVGHAHAGKMSVYRESDEFEVVGVVEPDPELRRRAQNSGVYKDLKWMTQEQLLNAPGIEVIGVETRVRDLLDTAETCVAAGKHIHIDKPAGESLPQFKRILDTAASKHLLVQMGYMYRYNPAFRFVFEAVREGWLGEVFEIHTEMSKTLGPESRKTIAAYPGGSMFELGCHVIDPLVYMMGPPTAVTGYVRRSGAYPDGLADNMLAVLEYPRATATVRSAVIEVEGSRRRQFVVCGDRGTVVIQPLEPPRLQLTLREPRGEYRKGTQIVELAEAPGRYDGTWLDFARVIRGEKPSDFSHAHDLAVQRAILQASRVPLT